MKKAIVGAVACMILAVTMSSTAGAQANLTCNGLPATIIGTDGFDRIYGTDGDDVIVSLGGRDVIRAGDGDDTICAGEGRDKVYGGSGDDWIDGGQANDRLIGQQGNDELFGSGGRDYLKGSTGSDVLRGGGGNDQLLDGGPGRDSVDGGRGLDRCEYFDNTMGNWAAPTDTGQAAGPAPCGELDVLGLPVLSSTRFLDAVSDRVDFAAYVTRCEPADLFIDSVRVDGAVLWTGDPLSSMTLQVSVGTFANGQWRELSSGNVTIDGMATNSIRSFSMSWIQAPDVPYTHCFVSGYGGDA